MSRQAATASRVAARKVHGLAGVAASGMAPKTYRVANLADIRPGELINVPLPGSDSEPGSKSREILLARIGDSIIAAAPHCTHYGAPLVKGVLRPDGRLTCPWHGACFNLCKGGDIEDAPAWDALPVFQTRVKQDGDIDVTIDDMQVLTNNRRSPTWACKSALTDDHVVIVGGGTSGYSTAECLREFGFNGKITIISKEPYYTIDRTKLSKALITDPSQISIRDKQHITSLNIEFLTGKTVISVDPETKKVVYSDGQICYHKLVLASGGTPKGLPLPNFDKANVFRLRQIDDAQAIVQAANKNGTKKNVVIIGSGFIGLEIASPLSKDHHVVVVGRDKVPLQKVLGDRIGQQIRKIHEKNGIEFRLDVELEGASLPADNSSMVSHVILKSGEKLPADIVIVAVGIAPATDYLQSNKALLLQKDGSLTVDEHMRVQGFDDIYATGDIATFPYHQLDASMRVEHWDVAMNHGRTAARHILKGDQAEGYDATLYFWSAQGSQLRYCGTTGPPVGYDDVLIQGDLEKPAFVAFFCKGEKIVAVCSMGYDPAVSLSAVLMKERKMPSKSELQRNDIFHYRV